MSLIVCGFYLDLALVIRVLTAFLFTCGILIAISRGWGKVGIALAKDPVGVAVPVLTCLAMIFTPQMSSMMIAG